MTNDIKKTFKKIDFKEIVFVRLYYLLVKHYKNSSDILVARIFIIDWNYPTPITMIPSSITKDM